MANGGVKESVEDTVKETVAAGGLDRGASEDSARQGSVGRERLALRVAIAATFTANPIEAPLRFWLDQLGFAGDVEHAPYSQVFQALLDPMSALGQNDGGVNLVLVRFEDFLRFANAVDAGRDHEALLSARVEELASALRSYASRQATPTLLWIGPASTAAQANREQCALFARLTETLLARVQDLPSVQLLEERALSPYPVPVIYDARRDEIGHIPYAPAFFSALGTAIARRIYALKTPAIKVIALDCDNTLWRGVVGEDGLRGITVPEGMLALQRAVIEQQTRGVVLCLLSKNAEEDVLEVLDHHASMLLTRKHLVGYRIDWQPKARNIAELARELNLGLDSFLFIDDNPVECAHMLAAHPQVLTFMLPKDDTQIPSFLEHLWPLDRLQVTEEDRMRTRMYQENAQRSSLERQAGNIAAFLEGLELEVDIAPPVPGEIPRIAQLTGRTNQFNFTTIRRNEADMAQLTSTGLECMRVTVSDRFGAYGLVGVMIFGAQGEVLRIDTLLLSCRVLGRGVEHAMLRELGKLALARGARSIEAPFSPTKKNQPAQNFLESLGVPAEPIAGGTRYTIDAELAAGLEYRPGADAAAQLELARTGGKTGPAAAVGNETARYSASAVLQRVTSEWRSVDAVHAAIEASAITTRPELDVAWTAPRNVLERELCELWQRLLHIDRVGVNDDFTALSGTSLAAAQLFAELDERYSVKLPMTTILDAPTVAALALRIADSERSEAHSSLRTLRKGKPGGPKLFLVHDGDGETLLYLNLARRLPEEVTVYGIEPLGDARVPMRHTRIPDMAKHYLDLVTREAPDEPYWLGGMCAGGTIAFEMALQLEARGRRVPLVALLDSADPEAKPKRGIQSKRRLTRFVNALRGRSQPPPPPDAPSAELIAANANKAKVAANSSGAHGEESRLQRAAAKLKNVIVYETQTRLAARDQRTRFADLRQVLERGKVVPPRLQHLSVRTVYDLAQEEYVPSRAPNAHVALFRATGGEGGDEAFVHLYEDPLLGWQPRLRRPLEVLDMPGGHASMLQEPYVATMAERMAACIKKTS